VKRKIENDKRAEEREYSLAGVGRGGGMWESAGLDSDCERLAGLV